jgi:hypothetical protein
MPAGSTRIRKRLLTPLQFLVTLALYAEASLLFGLAAFPAAEFWLACAHHAGTPGPI